MKEKAACQELTVLDITPLGQTKERAGFVLLRLQPPGWEDWRPGQFVMVRPRDWGQELTWGRPFSICTNDSSGLSLLIQVVGRGTKHLAALNKGDKVTVWGALGNGFSMEPGKKTLLLAGGIGVAPFFGYCLAHAKPRDLHLVFGHRAPLTCYPHWLLPEQTPFESHYEEKPEDLAPFLKRVEDLVREYAPDGLVLACGPTPFLRTVREYALKHGADAEISLENRMACGVGACLGCVTQSTEPGANPIQVCSHGPVFKAGQVNL